MRIKLALFLMAAAMVFTGCKKADMNKADVVFWWSKSSSDELMAFGVNSVTLEVNGEVVGSSGTDVYWTSAPDCGENGSMSHTFDMGESSSKTYTLKIYLDGQYGDEFEFTPEAGICNTLNLD